MSHRELHRMEQQARLEAARHIGLVLEPHLTASAADVMELVEGVMRRGIRRKGQPVERPPLAAYTAAAEQWAANPPQLEQPERWLGWFTEMVLGRPDISGAAVITTPESEAERKYREAMERREQRLKEWAS
jgi:hypothetical protein